MVIIYPLISSALWVELRVFNANKRHGAVFSIPVWKELTTLTLTLIFGVAVTREQSSKQCVITFWDNRKSCSWSALPVLHSKNVTDYQRYATKRRWWRESLHMACSRHYGWYSTERLKVLDCYTFRYIQEKKCVCKGERWQVFISQYNLSFNEERCHLPGDFEPLGEEKPS